MNILNLRDKVFELKERSYQIVWGWGLCEFYFIPSLSFNKRVRRISFQFLKYSIDIIKLN